MAIEKKESFIKQIAIYLNDNEAQKAYTLAKEFVDRFPSEMVAHYLLAKASFWLGKYDEALGEGLKAFNMARAADLVPCAIITASAYYQLGKYAEGHKMLSRIDAKGDADLEKLKLAFAIAQGQQEEAVEILDTLFRINKKEAKELLEKIVLA